MNSATRAIASKYSTHDSDSSLARSFTSSLIAIWLHTNATLAQYVPSSAPRVHPPMLHSPSQCSRCKHFLWFLLLKNAYSACRIGRYSSNVSATACEYSRTRNTLESCFTSCGSLGCMASRSMRTLSETSLTPCSLPNLSSATRVSASRNSNRISARSSLVCPSDESASSSKLAAMKTLSTSAVLQNLDLLLAKPMSLDNCPQAFILSVNMLSSASVWPHV
mmetsp:Transcript_47690/g.91098  ORF Transcript_47690/g.91098 Transcript_47690/m.91098 type:complete len:221 (+) Transcript_47690:574-1236(+)